MNKNLVIDVFFGAIIVILLAMITGLFSPVYADNDVTNSNNTNTSTQTNEITNTHHDSYDNHSNVADSSTHTDNRVDNSAYSHNTDSSYNQANKSWQTITNTNTEGDLSQSKNTNSFNSNTGNSNGSNVVQSANGGSAHSMSGSFSNSSATGGNSSATANGTNVVRTGSTQVNTGAVNVIHNQARQHRVVPFAYAPGLAMSFSQDNCANSASMGVSTGFGAISGGMPINNDACNRRKDVQMWLAVNQNRIACERMVQDEENMNAMRKAGMTCEMLTFVPPVVMASPSKLNVPPMTYWDKLDAIASAQISAMHQNRMKK